jgi:hypothetical protein
MQGLHWRIDIFPHYPGVFLEQPKGRELRLLQRKYHLGLDQ